MRRGRYGAFLALPGTARLLATSLLARMPLGMTSLAIVLLVRQRTGSFASAGVVVGAYTLCGAAASPVRGASVDRRGPRPALLTCALLYAGGLSGLVAIAQANLGTAPMALAAGASGGLTPPVDAAMRTLWPRVASEPEVLEAAYSLDATSQEIIWTLGPLLVAAAVALGSPSFAVVLVAAIGLSGTLLFAASPLNRREPHPSAGRTGTALASAGLRVLLITTLLTGCGIGAVEIALPALAVHAGTPGAAGVLLAVWSVGSMAGGLLAGGRTWRSAPPARLSALLLLVAVSTAPLIAARSVAAALPLTMVAGVGIAPMLACEYALVNLLAPRDAAAEAFSWNSASIVAGVAAGSAASGFIVQHAGVPYSFALGCAAAAGAAAVAAAARRWLRSAGRSPSGHDLGGAL